MGRLPPLVRRLEDCVMRALSSSRVDANLLTLLTDSETLIAEPIGDGRSKSFLPVNCTFSMALLKIGTIKTDIPIDIMAVD